MAGGDQVRVRVERDLDCFVQRGRKGRQRRRRREIVRRKTGEELIICNICFENCFGAGQSGARAFEASLRQRNIGPRHHAHVEPVRRRTDLLTGHFDIVFANRNGFEVAAHIDIGRYDLKDEILDGGIILRFSGVHAGLCLTDAGIDTSSGINGFGSLNLGAGNRTVAIRAGERRKSCV